MLPPARSIMPLPWAASSVTPAGRAGVTELEQLASRHDMRELVATAAALRARLGESGALETAVVIASEIDNPALHERIATARAAA